MFVFDRNDATLADYKFTLKSHLFCQTRTSFEGSGSKKKVAASGIIYSCIVSYESWCFHVRILCINGYLQLLFYNHKVGAGAASKVLLWLQQKRKVCHQPEGQWLQSAAQIDGKKQE